MIAKALSLAAHDARLIYHPCEATKGGGAMLV